MIIAVDFDGTCVSHEFPNIGEDIGAAPILRRLVERGHMLILFTMRSDVTKPAGSPSNHDFAGKYLTDAVKWFEKNGITLWGINENPTQMSWTYSPKPYADLYIDDAALGAPLKFDGDVSKKPFVDWNAVEQYLIHKGAL